MIFVQGLGVAKDESGAPAGLMRGEDSCGTTRYLAQSLAKGIITCGNGGLV